LVTAPALATPTFPKGSPVALSHQSLPEYCFSLSELSLCHIYLLSYLPNGQNNFQLEYLTLVT